jgi:hypothetical protein
MVALLGRVGCLAAVVAVSLPVVPVSVAVQVQATLLVVLKPVVTGW